jgi:hypothetical protein
VCAGRIDFFEVTLNPGESITIPLDLTKYLDLSNSKQGDGTFPLEHIGCRWDSHVRRSSMLTDAPRLPGLGWNGHFKYFAVPFR